MPAPKKRARVKPLLVHLDPPLLAWLRLEAKRRDVSMSELVRRMIREKLDDPRGSGALDAT